MHIKHLHWSYPHLPGSAGCTPRMSSMLDRSFLHSDQRPFAASPSNSSIPKMYTSDSVEMTPKLRDSYIGYSSPHSTQGLSFLGNSLVSPKSTTFGTKLLSRRMSWAWCQSVQSTYHTPNAGSWCLWQCPEQSHLLVCPIVKLGGLSPPNIWQIVKCLCCNHCSSNNFQVMKRWMCCIWA